jgi:holo-[acyl-carrier protein] synthase
MKTGIDIVKISRIEKAAESEAFVNRVFTESEREYCKNSASLAGLFAAKEAYLKALGTGIDRRMTEVEIAHDEKGKPYIKGVQNSDLSISHDGDFAVASVILW